MKIKPIYEHDGRLLCVYRETVPEKYSCHPAPRLNRPVPTLLSGRPLLRRARFFNRDNDRNFTFLANNFLRPSLTIAEFYKLRRHVDLFFRWIKQNLRIKSPYGTSENAVRAQSWVAIAIYALVAISKKKMSMDLPPYNFLQILSVSAFEKAPLNRLLTFSDDHDSESDDPNQFVLFDF
ncbi:MAG: transposase [Candidatus Aminicenantes bacterium]|nr:transposase [Candidatus Aminicenantes bacterium]